MTDVLRVLGSIRQSKTRDRAVSPAAQRATITRWTDGKGYRLAKFTEDLSRSGKVSPFKRPELGPYLTDPLLMATWDILVTTKIDRACRNTRDFLALLDWCKSHGKTYVSLKESIDLTTAQGREYARQAASRAEWMRDIASEQRLETLAEMQEQGRWCGGRVPYGLRAEQRDDGYYLVPDTGGTAAVAGTMADMSIAGHSNGAIQCWLNGKGYPNADGGPWSTERVRLVLHSAAMEQVLGRDKHAHLKLALRSRRQAKGQWTPGRHMLLRVAFCMACGSPLYGRIRNDRPNGRGYYRCMKCEIYLPKQGCYQDGEWVPGLEDATIGSLMLIAGDEIVHRKVVRPGDQRTAERYDLVRQIDTLREITDADVSAAITSLEDKLREITDSLEPGTEEWEPGGQTVAAYWKTLDIAGKGAFLRDAKVRVEADKTHFRFRITEAGVIQMTHPGYCLPQPGGGEQ